MNSDILFENQIAIVVPVKNESRYIGEWLEYHYRIGVDKFYIYDNDSEDREELQKILAPWISEEIVEYKIMHGAKIQLPAYCNAIKKHQFDCKYMAFIDVDEFIFVKTGQTLLEFLDECFSQAINIGGLTINWRMFGSSGLKKYSPEPVLERFTHRALDEYNRNKNVKTIANPRWLMFAESPHRFKYRMGCCSVDENLLETTTNSNPRNTCNKIQLNHYYTKSLEECLSKYDRGRADTILFYPDEQFKLDDRNEIEDTMIRDFARKVMNQPRRRSRHGRKIQLQNLIAMLENPSNQFQGKLEKFLTCFHLSQTIENLSREDRNILARISLQSILKSLSLPEIKQQDALLLLDEMPLILRSRLKEAWEIFERCKVLSSELMQAAILHSRDLSTYERILQTSVNYRYLGEFLNQSFFEE